MTGLRTIEIDFDIHKLIEAERNSFDEPQYFALRRLLKLGNPKIPPQDPGQAGRPWVGDRGEELPHGTDLRMRYDRGRQVYSGKIVNGKWHFDQGVFDSPSGAASGLAVTKKDEKTKLNGYNYLEFRLPGSEKWVFLRDLRDARGRKEIDLSKVVLMKAKQPIGK